MQNALVKRAVSLRLHKYRRQHRAFLVEGADLVAAGLAAGLRPQAVFLLEGSTAEDKTAAALPANASGGLPVTPVTRRVAEKITTLETPPAVMAIFPALQPPPLATLRGPGLLAVYADRIADPGNLGTLVRAAAAFGATALLVSPGGVDPFSPKVVRATMGAIFALPLYPDHLLAAALRDLEPAHVYGLVAHDGADLATSSLRLPAVLCVGAERAGLSPEVSEMVTERLTIRLASAAAVESVNAGVAGAIALYEFSRHGARPSGATPTTGG
jgi:TrmH family RNA methyltransferase